MAIFSEFTIPAFMRHVTIPYAINKPTLLSKTIAKDITETVYEHLIMKSQNRVGTKLNFRVCPHKIITYTKIHFKIKIKLYKIRKLNFISTLDGCELSVSGTEHFIEGQEYRMQDKFRIRRVKLWRRQKSLPLPEKEPRASDL
jgi:hypothetical protein